MPWARAWTAWAGRRLAAPGRLGRGRHISQPRMYYGCTRRTRRKTLAVGAVQERRTASTPPAGACARRPPAPRLRGRLRRPGSPALSRARPGRRRLRRPDPARARGDHQPALAMLRAWVGPAARAIQDRILVASWAGRPDEVTQTYAQLPAGAQPPADVRLAVARALRDLRRWPEALAQFRAGMRAYPSARLRRRHRHDAGGRRPARRGAGRGRAAGPRPPRDADAHWPWPMSMHAGIRRLKRCTRPTARAT